MGELLVRPAVTRDCRPLVDMLFRMHAEVGRAPVELAKGLWAVDEVVHKHAAWIVEDEDELVGSLGIVPYEPWFTADEFLTERWFYVAPSYRHDGRAFKMLLAEITALCAATGMPAMLTYFNPKRPGRRLSSIGEKIFVNPPDDAQPAGEAVLIDPKAG